MTTNATPAGTKSPMKKTGSLLLGIFIGVLKLLGDRLLDLANMSSFVRLRYLDFTLRPDDIFIVSYPRSGTTWVQMILYQLTTDGSMDFQHIYEVCPHFESPLSYGKDFEDRPSPRMFKTHLFYKQLPKGPCKYIYVARNGKDVAVSLYHFITTQHGFRWSFQIFFALFVRGRMHGSWFKHVGDWWVRRDDPNVLFLKYEELIHDLEGCVRKIIDFCQFQVDEANLPGILERCRFDFMKQYESKFDPITERLMLWGVKQHEFLRKGQVGDWKNRLTPEQEAAFDRQFARLMSPLGIDFGSSSASVQAAGQPR
jgi:hypothetical protein